MSQRQARIILSSPFLPGSDFWLAWWGQDRARVMLRDETSKRHDARKCPRCREENKDG